MLWTIAIAGIPERFHSCQPLLYSLLETQGVARLPDVECLYLLDNKRRTVGAKRNALLDMARGEYVSFIDDDDMVAADYVKRIHDAINQARRAKVVMSDITETLPDVICFGQRATLHPHGVTHECTYSLEHWRNRKPEDRRQLAPAPGPDGKPLPNVLLWTGPPAHTQVWRRAILEGIRFPEQQFGEDVIWVDEACARASTEICLNGSPMYFYQFDAERSATRG